MLIHDLRSGCRGNLGEMKAQVERGTELQERIERAVLKGTNLKRRLMRRLMSKERFINAEDTIKYGMADTIIDDIDQISKTRK